MEMNNIFRKKLLSDSRRMLSVGTGLPSGCVLPPLLLSAQHPFYGTHGIQHLSRHSQQPQYPSSPDAATTTLCSLMPSLQYMLP